MDSLAAAVGFSYRHMACTNSQSLDSNFAGIFVQLVARVLALEVVNKLMKVCYEQTDMPKSIMPAQAFTYCY